MAEMKRRSESDGPLTKRVAPDDVDSTDAAGPDDGAWNDRLAAARAQREAVLAEKARNGEPEAKSPQKPWERAEAAAAERRKRREETGSVTRLQPTKPRLVLTANNPQPVTEEHAVDNGAGLAPVVAAQEEPSRNRRVYAAALLFLVGLGAGVLIAAPDRIASGLAGLRALVSGEPQNAEATVAPNASIAPRREAPLVQPGGAGLSGVALAEVTTAQAAFRVGPPEPFTERSAAPQDVAQAFFAVQSPPRFPDEASRELSGLSSAGFGGDAPTLAKVLGRVEPLSAPLPLAAVALHVPEDEGASFLRYGPFHPVAPRADGALAAISTRPPTDEEGQRLYDPVVATTNVVHLTAPDVATVPVDVDVVLELKGAQPSAPRRALGGLVVPAASPASAAIERAPVRLASLDIAALAPQGQIVTAFDAGPDALMADHGFARLPVALPSQPAPESAAASSSPLAPVAVQLAGVPQGLNPDAVQGSPVRLAMLWADEGPNVATDALVVPDAALLIALPNPDTTPPAPLAEVALPAPGANYPDVQIAFWAPTATPDARVQEADDAIRAAGFDFGAPKRLDITITQDQVRYFQPEYRDAAEALAEAIGGRARDFTNYRPSPADGTIEIWLKGDEPPAPPARVARAPAPRQPTRAQREQQELLQLRQRLLQTLRQNDF